MLYPIAIMVKLGTTAFALIPPFENGQCYHVSHLHSPRQLKFTSSTNSSKMGYDNTHHPYHSNCPLQCFILLIASLYFVHVHHEKWLPFTYNPASVITRNRPCSHYFRCPIFNYVICSWNHGNKYAGNCTEILIRHVWLQLCKSVCSFKGPVDECNHMHNTEKLWVNRYGNKSLFQALESSPVVFLLSNSQKWRGNWTV